MFNTLPTSTRKPGIYVGYDTTLASRNLPANPQRVLIMGQRLSTGTVAALVAAAVFSDKDAAAYFGSGSAAHLMCRAAIAANPYVDLTGIGIDDAAGGTQATQTVTFTGPATGSGSATLTVGTKTITIAISATDTATAIAGAMNTAANLVLDLPVTGAALAVVLTLTAKNKGTIGNGIPVTCMVTAAGVTATVASGVTGATDPDIAAALTAIFPVRYQLIATQFSAATNMGKLRTHLETVSGKVEQRGAHGYAALTGTLAASITIATTTGGGRLIYTWSRGNSALACEIAAAYAAYRASVDDPAMPLDDDVLPGVTVPPAQADWPSRTEQESALHNALTPLYVGIDNRVRICRAITSYMVDDSGNPDETLLDDNPLKILDYVRDVVRAISRPKKCTQKRANSYRDLILTQLRKLEKAEILMNVDTYKARLQVIANPEDRPAGWFKVTIPAPYVPGLHILDETIELYL